MISKYQEILFFEECISVLKNTNMSIDKFNKAIEKLYFIINQLLVEEGVSQNIKDLKSFRNNREILDYLSSSLCSISAYKKVIKVITYNVIILLLSIAASSAAMIFWNLGLVMRILFLFAAPCFIFSFDILGSMLFERGKGNIDKLLKYY